MAGDLTYSLHCRTSYAADKSASLDPYDVDMTDAAVYLPQSRLLYPPEEGSGYVASLVSV